MSPECPRLRVRSVAIDAPGDLLARIPESTDPREVVTWLRESDGLAGWGEAAAIFPTGRGRFADAEQWWAQLLARATVTDEVRLPGSGLVAFGSFAFADASADPSVLTVPRVLLGRRDGIAWVTQVAVGDEPWPPGHPSEVLGPDRTHALTPGPLIEHPGAISAEDWPSVIGSAVARIDTGEVGKVVLARDLVVRRAHTGTEARPGIISIAPILARLASRYAATWTFAVHGLIGATPEMLVRMQGGQVRSRVLAGTIRSTASGHGIPTASSPGPTNPEHPTDPRLRLVSSDKDLDEHAYAVRSVSQALGPYCRDLLVPEDPYVLELPDVYHLASDLTGTVSNGATSLRLAAALHPSAAVCGTPTAAAARVIAELEGMDRGRYAGPVGWLDSSGEGDWAIALRCGELAPDRQSLRLFAGGGIVSASDPESELAETEAKFTAMRYALGLR